MPSSSISATRKPLLSLRTKLTVAFALVTLVVTAIVLIAGWVGARDSGRKIAQDLVDRAAEGIAHQISDYTREAKLIGGSVVAAFNSGVVKADDARTIRKYLWDAAQVSELANYVYVGDESGQFVGVERQYTPEPKTFYRVRARADTMLRTYQVSSAGEQGNVVEAQTVRYDPRERGWYKRAKEARTSIWTAPYLSASKNIMVVTYASPLLDASGAFVGAVGIDFTLKNLQTFFEKLRPTPHANAYLVAPSGEVIVATDKSVGQLPTEIREALGASVAAPGSRDALLFGDSYYGAHVLDGAIPGKVVLSIPRAELWGDKLALLWRALQWGLLALGLAALIGWRQLRKLLADIHWLTLAAESSADDDAEKLPLARRDEIGRLAQAFAGMKRRMAGERKQNESLIEEGRVREQANEARLVRARGQVRRLAAVVESAQEPIAVLRPDFFVEYANFAFAQLFTASPKDMVGRAFTSLIQHDSADIYVTKLKDGLSQFGTVRETVVLSRGDELEPRVHLEVTLTPVTDDAGKVTEITLIGRDVTQTIQKADVLTKQANYDPLTGLMRKAGFVEALRERLDREPSMSLLFVDLDGFKQVNDTFGHAAGDAVLTEIGQLIGAATRDTDLTCRSGGDEFMIALFNDAEQITAHSVADRLNGALQKVGKDQFPGCTISASIGIASYPEDGASVELLIRYADAAMYAAKRDGGMRWAAWNESVERLQP